MHSYTGYLGQPVPYNQLYYQPSVNRNVTDTQGRSFPGNDREADGYVSVKCWSPDTTVVVRIIDTCPCLYAPKGSAPYFQHSCCGNLSPEKHTKSGTYGFDISFWAFEKLAHPL